MGADYRQQQEQEEEQLYSSEFNEWLAINKQKFNEIFGGNDEQLSDTKND